MKPYTYKAECLRVVDGDTIDVRLDLGFNIYHKGRVRLMGIDTPESRTRDLEEKKFGFLAKQYLKDWIHQHNHILVESTEKGKFGRILGNIWNPDGTECVNIKIIEDHHAVPYFGLSKEDVQTQHLANRIYLTEQGFVV